MKGNFVNSLHTLTMKNFVRKRNSFSTPSHLYLTFEKSLVVYQTENEYKLSHVEGTLS